MKMTLDNVAWRIWNSPFAPMFGAFLMTIIVLIVLAIGGSIG